ncbi:MAG: hypothetical protein WBA57_10795 [Elainellaceae cyanobacterium]
MLNPFPIVKVSPDAPEESEVMGTKEKFWFRNQESELCLYKKARPNTGEDWSEKIAAELSQLIGLPHADYELAVFRGDRGIISPSFLPKNGSLVPGNEVLAKLMPDYPKAIRSPSCHSINNIFQALKDPSVHLPTGWTPPDGITTVPTTFVGYLLLDTWIGNADRHHENWAFIQAGGIDYLSPTYDHASSLGRNESDDKREQRLTTKDKGFSVNAYVERCKSCLYAGTTDKKPLKTFEAFCAAANLYPDAARIWLESLESVSSSDTLRLFKRIPGDRISSTAIKFAQAMLTANRDRLLNLRDSLQ